MARQEEFRVLVATDGSRHAQAAIETTVHFPWPTHMRVRAVIATKTRTKFRQSFLLPSLDRGVAITSDRARRMLGRRWSNAEIQIVDQTPVEGILGEAQRFQADAIVVGWRGHGAVRRVLMGSVSRGVVRGATCAVLVVREPQHVRRLVIGFDGSPTARQSVEFVARLVPPQGGDVRLVSVVELMTVPSRRRVPGAAEIAREIRRMNTLRSRTATQELDGAAAELKRRGWPTRTVVAHGEPLRELLAAVNTARAQLLVVGARGTSGVRRLLLGSVTEGALTYSPVGVLVAR